MRFTRGSSVSNPNSMKLQTFLAHAGIAARRKAEEFIAAGRVSVNNQPAHLGQRIVPGQDEVRFDDQVVTASQPIVTYLVYKPAGIISTTSDELDRQNIVMYLQSLLPKDTPLPRLYPVGRLDLDSEGLMIMTNDGELAQHFTHPSFEVPKTYQVTVEGHPTDLALAHLERGVKLREGMTAPAQVRVLSQDDASTTLEVTIHEGRYHQVKRMLQRVGYEVIRLVRTKIGPYSLADLADQQFRRV